MNEIDIEEMKKTAEETEKSTNETLTELDIAIEKIKPKSEESFWTKFLRIWAVGASSRTGLIMH